MVVGQLRLSTTALLARETIPKVIYHQLMECDVY